MKKEERTEEELNQEEAIVVHAAEFDEELGTNTTVGEEAASQRTQF